MYDIFTKEILYNANEKESAQILSQTKDNQIRKSIFHEDANQFLIVLIVGKYDLIFYYVSTQSKGQRSIKRFPTIKEHGEIRDVCFNSSGDNIYVLFQEGLIVCLKLLEEKHLVDLNANLICTKSICSPTNIIVWYSFDGQQEIAIVGNDIGELCFVNIDKRQLVRRTNIKKSIKNLRIIRDKFTVTLLITAIDNTQLKLPLEENRLSLILNQDNDADNIKFMEENRSKLFSCFINDGVLEDEDQDKINLSVEKMNIKPVQILNNQDCILINQQSFILATYYQEITNACSLTSLAAINIYEGNEFTYEFTTPLSKYCFPRECVSLDHIIELVTERLIITANQNLLFIISKQCSDSRREKTIESPAIISSIEFDSKIMNVFRLNEVDNYLDTLIVVTSQCAYKLKPKMSCENIFIELIISKKYKAHEMFAFMMRLNLNNLYKQTTHHFLQNKQYQKVLDLFASDNISKLELIKNFLYYGYLNEAISIISHLFEEKNDLDDQDKVSLANVYVACSIQRILEKKVLENEKNITKLKRFLTSNIYYNEQYVIKLLIGSYMFNLARLCAGIRNNYACLIRNLLNVEQVQSELLNNGFDQTIYEKIVKQSIYSDVLLVEPFRCTDYFECLLTKDILQGFFIESDLISIYLKTLIETLPKLDDRLLKKVSRLFDPHKPLVQILLNNVVNKNSTKKYMYDDGEQANKVQKKDVINFFIFVNLVILKNRNVNALFDRRILDWNKNKPYETNNALLNVHKTPDEQDYAVSAGQSRSFLIKLGNLFSCGSSKYGADAEVNTSTTGKRFEPKINTYFSDLLAIKVLGISSGAHHTLILTKAGCFAVGQSIYGQLGCGNKIQYTRYPKIIDKLQHLNVQKLVCGQYHSFALTLDGSLLSWGWGIHGQLGHDDTEIVYEPKLIKYFKKRKVVDVSAGYCHSIVLDSDGLVYSFGSNVYGQLGCGAEAKVKKRNLPEPIYLIDDRIDLISSRYFQTLAYSKKNRTIYYFGTSPQYIKLMAKQLKKMRNNSEQNSQQNANQAKFNNTEHYKPRKLKLDEFEIKKLETGSLHFLLLTTDGRVFSWGHGPDGQIGHGCENSIVLPTQINDLGSNPIVDIACGYDFSLCVDIFGELFGFGQNEHHQLGFQSKVEQKLLNGVNNLLESNKRLLLKNKKVLKKLSDHQVEKKPVHVEFKSESSKKLNYFDSMSIEFGLNRQENDEFKLERSKKRNSRRLDNFSLCDIIFKLRNELDLHMVLNTCVSLDNHLCVGFIFELLKEPLNALDYYMKAADNSIEQVKEIIAYFINQNMKSKPTMFKRLLVRFIHNWLEKHKLEELEQLLIEIYEEKVDSFLFGLFMFELIEQDELKICVSNEFKIKLMKVTCKYLKSAKLSEFNHEPATSLLSSISTNQNLASAEKLWKNILNNIQKELDNKKSTDRSNSTDEQSNLTDDYYENGIEIVPEDNQIYIFSCNHHFNSDYYSSIILKQIKILNNNEKDDSNPIDMNIKCPSTRCIKCPLCLKFDSPPLSV